MCASTDPATPGEPPAPRECGPGAACVNHCGTGPCSRRCQVCQRLAGLPTEPCPACPDAPARPLPDYLSGHAFARARCLVVAGEDAMAARARGSAAECAADALMLLRGGNVREAVSLLNSALGYAERWRGPGD